MNYAAILAGGVGTRVNSIDYPKQFYTIDGKPVIIYTTEKLVNSSLIDLVYIAVIEDYYDYMMALLEEYNLTEKTVLITGGKTRMDTIDKVVEAILQIEYCTVESLLYLQVVEIFHSSRELRFAFPTNNPQFFLFVFLLYPIIVCVLILIPFLLLHPSNQRLF